LLVRIQALIVFMWHPDYLSRAPPPKQQLQEEEEEEEEEEDARDAQEIVAFLKLAGLDAREHGYLEKLMAAGTAHADLPHIEDGDLQELGMATLMHRKRFLWRAAKLGK
jgi:hypothetical protein